MKRINIKRQNRKGFTLVELLIVMGILAILAAMVVPKILTSRDKANVNAAKSQIGMLQSSLENYNLDMRNYPTTEQGLNALLEEPSTKDGGKQDAKTNWSGPYVNKAAIPKDPWNNVYQYEYPPTHGKNMDEPNIWSFGPDGQDGTEDDIVSWVNENNDKSGNDSPRTRETHAAN